MSFITTNPTWNFCVDKFSVNFFLWWLQEGQVNTASSPPRADLLLPKTDSNNCFNKSSFI